MKNFRYPLLCAALLLTLTIGAHAAAPALRQQVSLNGTWEKGGVVPNYSGTPNLGSKTFERRVEVPAQWAGKNIAVEFVAVNFVAEVFVNDQLLLRHVGGWSPFAVDVTSHVKAGESFRLKVVVHDAKNALINGAKGKVVWPVGAWSGKGGIADDVWLRAYGAVAIEDAFIQTSFRHKTLKVDYTLHNSDSKSRTVTLRGAAAPSNGGESAKALETKVVLAGGERKVVSLGGEWQNPTLYWPDSPFLYHLKSQIVENGAVVDEETRRFGFREFWIEGNQFRWNGVRLNIFGDYLSLDGGYHSNGTDLTPQGFAKTADKLKALGIRAVRWHHSPTAQYILDICDEKGLLVCSEAANYARPFHLGNDQNQYIANAVLSVEPWIVSQRNHPSIYLWNATNEMTYPQLGGFSAPQVEQIGAAIARLDPTRPVGYDGDSVGKFPKSYGQVKGALVNIHYPEGYNKEPKGSIYSWAKWTHPTRPTGSGEMFHTHETTPKSPEMTAGLKRNTWWLGIWTRGLRFANWTDVRPAVSWFALKDLGNPDPKWQQRAINLRNAYAPVALFDKEYDDLGIAPYVTGTTPGGVLPVAIAGAKLNRTLILYNDEFRDTTVKVEVVVKSGAEIVARGAQNFTVELGDHIEIPCSFQVPFGSEMELVLRTSKGGALKFEEARRFRVTGASTGSASPQITFGGR